MSIFRKPSRLAATALIALAACDRPSEPAPMTGTLALAVAGLPDTIDAEIALTGPGGYSTRITETRSLAALVPGSYTITASRVTTGTATFVPAFESLAVTVGANAVSTATVIYSLTTGSIAVTVTGAPPDVPWQVTVTGPAGFRDSVSANRTLGNLAPGAYTLSAPELSRGTSVYVPKPSPLVVTVTASLTAVPAAIGYSLTTGSLSLHVNGLPAGVGGNVSVTGPAGFVRTLSGSITLDGLRQGRYDLVAAPVSGQGTWSPAPATQSVLVVPGATSAVSVNYRPGSAPPGLNLAVEAIQVQQVVQTYGGGVPSIAGREALLRVFVRASGPNAVAPSVRVRLYDGPQLVTTVEIPPPGAGVPTEIDEGQLTTSWNYAIPATLMNPGLRVLADVDPANSVAESDEGDNTYPSSGAPLTLDVRDVPPLAVRLVPVTQTSTGLTGDVTQANAAQYAAEARRLLPVNAFTLDVREPYTTNAPPLQPNDANGAWVRILSELNALRALEATTAHYYGVVKAPYTTGIAGLSYLPSVVAVGWDTLPHAAATMVHELGHNFGRLHTRSCGAGGADANYPYANGVIGVYGYDLAAGTLLPPSTPDIMGYCDNRWISDYHYTGILGFRAMQARNLAPTTAPRPGLLIWGRIGAAGPVLEPAFEVNAAPRLPTSGGPYRIEILDVSGQFLAGYSFHGERVVDAPGGADVHFAFVVPMETFRGAVPARLRLLTPGRGAELTTTAGRSLDQVAGDFVPVAQRISPSKVRLSWRDAPGRGVLVRDARTGVVLSFSRGGRVDVVTSSPNLDLTFSDGVRSTRRSIQVR